MPSKVLIYVKLIGDSDKLREVYRKPRDFNSLRGPHLANFESISIGIGVVLRGIPPNVN